MENHTYLYEYTVESLRKTLKEEVDEFSSALESMSKNSLFKIGDNSFRILKMLDISFWKVINKCTRNLIFNLMDIYDVPYIKTEGVDFCIQSNGEKVGYIISNAPKFSFDIEKVSKGNIEKVVYLVLEEKVNDEYIVYEPNYPEYKQKYKGLIKNEPISQFFDMWLSGDEYRTLKQYIEIFNLEAENIIGIRTTLIPTDKLMVQYRDKVLERLHKYQYQEKFMGVFDDKQFAVINERFEKRMDVLIGNTDFAKSFVSSEWYYDMQIKTDMCLEQTAIVAGYFKAVEQLLFAIVKLSMDRNISIEVLNNEKKDGEGKYIPLTQENLSRVNAMLGSLRNCISFYKNDMYAVDMTIKNVTEKKLADYCKKCRNGYFHKDNVYSWNQIEEIREKTYQIMFLIIGCLRIEDSKIEILRNGFIEYIEPKLNNISYESFANWLDKSLRVDALYRNPVLILSFQPGFNDGIHKMNISVGDKYIDNGFGIPIEGKDYFRIAENTLWNPYTWQSDEEIDVVEVNLKLIVKDYLTRGEMSSVLKGRDIVAVGRLGHYEIVYSKL